MYTCCPHCQTCFRITKAQLDVAQGKVRCGHCQEIFNGKENLRENISASESKPSPTATQPIPSTVSPLQPEAEKDLAKSAAADFDLFDLNSIPDSTTEEKAWLEEPKEQADDFVVVESDEWLEDDESDDDVTLNLDMDDYEFDAEEETPVLPETDIQTEKPTSETPSRYEFVDNEMPEEQQDIDQFIAEVNAQLSEAIEEPAKTDPFHLEKEMNVDFKSGLKPEVDEPEEPFQSPTSRTDDEFKKAFLANLDSDLALEPISSESAPEQTVPEPTPPEPIFPPATEPAKPEVKPDMGAVDDILTTARQPTTTTRPVHTDNIPFHLRDSLLVEEKPRNPIKLIFGMLAILIFSAVLLGQLAFFRSSQLVDKVPALQSMVEKFCTSVPCVYSGPRDVNQIKLVSRDIRLHPKVDNALLISATFINRASFKQAYPDITVTLSDLSGAIVAQRQFKPAEYLGRLNSPFLLMSSGKPVQIALEVVDPGKDAVNFEFTFQ